MFKTSETLRKTVCLWRALEMQISLPSGESKNSDNTLGPPVTSLNYTEV
uniref:Uncharacterized protein n=1 Tax=Anguilla anguilla TaxID=7936 RepID=A0A0E9RH29_ANGAN